MGLASTNSALSTLGLASLLLLLQGCSGDTHDVGEGLILDRSELGAYAASWDGYVEAFEFASGSDRVRVTLDASGNGTIRFGDAALVAPPTDPNVGYPPEVVAKPFDSLPGVGMPYEGFVYTVQGASVEDERIRFQVNSRELYADWCELQTPLSHTQLSQSYDANGMLISSETITLYSCSGNGLSFDGMGCVDPDTANVIDCSKVMLCTSAVCACTAEGCTGGGTLDVALDAALDEDGNALEGTLTVGGRATVRLERQ
jgi:hypothetical protein